MTRALQVLMLLTDGYGGVGGIQKFNRDFLQALDSCPMVERVYATPRLIPRPIEEAIPESVIYDRRAAAGKAAFMFRLAAHAWRMPRVDVVVCGHIRLLPAAYLLARVRHSRLALIIHGLEAWEPPYKYFVRSLTKTVDTFISVSSFSAERFTRWSKVPIDRAFILPNCVDLNHFKPGSRNLAFVERYGLQSSKVILTVGRLGKQERYKGFDEVIEVMPQLLKQFPNLKYLIVGDGPDRPRLEAKAGAFGVSDNVVFTGFIAESEKVAHYNLADVYVMPSLGEGFGIVLIEAAACGVAVVGSRSDGSGEALLDGRLGHLVDPSNQPEVVQAITSALEKVSSSRRIDAIKTFNVENFKTRVADWCRAQLAETATVARPHG